MTCGVFLPSQRRLLLGIVAIAAAVVSTARGAEVGASREDAERLKKKIAAITEHAAAPARQGRAERRTAVTENELNGYLAFEAASQMPAGVVEPSVSILGGGRVSGRAVVDLDAVRKERNPTSLLDPMTYLRGRLPIVATGMLETGNGAGRFDLEAASVGGVPIPKFVLQEIVSYYSRTPQHPSGISLDEPFALPARIREIRVERGQAILIQ